MMTRMKTVLFTDKSRASPNDTDGLTKEWVFNGDTHAMGIRRQQSQWFSGYDLRRNDWK